MKAAKKEGRSTLGKREREAITSKKTRQVHEASLLKSLEFLRTLNRLTPEMVAILSDMRHLDMVPKSAHPLIDELVARHRTKRRGRFD